MSIIAGAYNKTACVSCEAGTYQYMTGMSKCFRCSSSSTSLPGAELCTCVGLYRAFQPGDGWCICQPGYQFIDSNLVASSEDDGVYDCQPFVYNRCVAPQVRNALGNCVDGSAYCSSFCGSGGGSLSLTTGIIIVHLWVQ